MDPCWDKTSTPKASQREGVEPSLGLKRPEPPTAQHYATISKVGVRYVKTLLAAVLAEILAESELHFQVFILGAPRRMHCIFQNGYMSI